MEGIIFDLKKFRTEQLNGMSQEEFARLVGISQDKVSRMETNPEQISLEIIMNISSCFGIGLNELISIPKPKVQALKVKDTWNSAEYIKRTIVEYIRSGDMQNSEVYAPEIEKLSKLVTGLIKKPKVAFIGRSDVGKSSMINALLGSDRLPAHWTPTTAISVNIKHVKDRPSFMDEDVWIFKSDPQNGDLWDDAKLNDEAYCRSLKLSAGNYGLLETYGTRKGEHFAAGQATSAVAFVDSDLLLNCDIIDLPGYGTGDRVEDDTISLQEKNKADVFVYLSLTNGFMRSEDIAYIKEMLPKVGGAAENSLSNLFIVASQAHIVNNKVELNTILDEGCSRLEKALTESFWRDGRTPETLRKRFFTYSTDNILLREAFEKDFRSVIEALPDVIETNAKNVIRNWAASKDKFLKDTIDGYSKLLTDRDMCEKILEEYIRNEPNRSREFQNAMSDIKEKIAQYKRQCIEELEAYYSKIITVDHLEELIKARDVRKKKDDIQIFSSYVSGLLTDKAEAIMKEKSELFMADLEGFLTSFERFSTPDIQNNFSFGISTFNKEQAFAGGLAGMATYGALAIWAASCGNLGGYILLAKGVSLLSALGISVGGTAAAASALASVGGPVVIGIALAVLAALAVFAAFSGSWRRSVAKKIVDAFRNEKVLEKLSVSISNYWDDTEAAFLNAANSLDQEWKLHLNFMREQLSGYNINGIKAAIEEAQAMRNFLQNIPF